MDDAKRRLFAWLKKAGVLIRAPKTQAIVPEEASAAPKPLVTPQTLSEQEARKIMDSIKADLEKSLGQTIMMVPLGMVQIEPCGCKHCQMRAKAPWN